MNAPAFIPPSARDEAWRLSPLRGWDFATYSAPALPLITMPNKPDWADQHVALVNGAPSASHSLLAIEAAPDASGAAALTAPGGEGAFAAWAGETAQGILDLSTLGPTVLLSLYAAGEGALAANWLRLRVPAGQEFTLVEELRGRGTHLLNTRLEIRSIPAHACGISASKTRACAAFQLARFGCKRPRMRTTTLRRSRSGRLCPARNCG